MTKTIIDGWARLPVAERAKQQIVEALMPYPPSDRAALLVRGLVNFRQEEGLSITDGQIADMAKRLGLDAAPIIEAYTFTVTKDA